MLHNKIQSTIGLIEDVVDNRRRETDNVNTARRNSIFFDSLEKLMPSIASYILVKNNFNFELQKNSISGLSELISYSKNTFDNSKAVNPTSFKQKTESFINTVTQEWTNFYNLINDDLIDGLNIIALVHPVPSTVKNCISSLKKCEKWPLTQENIDTYNAAKQEANNLLKEMRFDDEIRQFLEKVRDKRATLTDLTPSILDWIQSENISDKVSLSIRNTTI